MLNALVFNFTFEASYATEKLLRCFGLIPKPHHLLPHLNPGWFYLSGTSIGLSRLSWKTGH